MFHVKQAVKNKIIHSVSRETTTQNEKKTAKTVQIGLNKQFLWDFITISGQNRAKTSEKLAEKCCLWAV